MVILDILVLVFYFGVGTHLSNQAFRQLRDPRKAHWFSPMFDPNEFTPEGNQLRTRAMQFWNWAGVAVLLYFVFIS